MGWGQRVKPHALRRHRMEKILTPPNGTAGRERQLCPCSYTDPGYGPRARGGDRRGGWVRRCPPPGRTKLALELGDSVLLQSRLGGRAGKEGPPARGRDEREQEMETREGQGPTKSLSRSSCPHPPMAQCWALPGGNPFNVSAIHLPGVPSAPLLIPVVLLPRDGA